MVHTGENNIIQPTFFPIKNYQIQSLPQENIYNQQQRQCILENTSPFQQQQQTYIINT